MVMNRAADADGSYFVLHIPFKDFWRTVIQKKRTALRLKLAITNILNFQKNDH